MSSIIAPAKLALLIGINKYDYITDLKGCVTDIKAVKDTLVNKFGFPDKDENIECLLSKEDTKSSDRPTRANILAAFERLIGRAQNNKGAIVVFHYSGHGSVQPNIYKPTGQNETIVPCDSGRLKKDGGKEKKDASVPESKDISDEELRDIFTRLAQHAGHVVAIFDSCHSESMTRAPDETSIGVRIVKYDSRLGTIGAARAARNGKKVEHKFAPTMDNVVAIAACAYNNVAYEVQVEGEPRGKFSYYWCKALQSFAEDKLMTYGDVFDLVTPNFNKSQTPKIEGEWTWQLFGSSKLYTQRFTRVIDQDEDDIQLNIGGAHLVTKGSVFGIYKPDIRSPDGSSQLTATVMSVGSTTLWAKLNQKPNVNLNGYRAFELKRSGAQIAINLPANCPDHVKEGLSDYYRVVDEKDAELIVRELPPGDNEQFNVNISPSKPALAVIDKNNTIILPLDESDKKEVITTNLIKYARYQLHLNNNNNETAWKDQIEFIIYRVNKRLEVLGEIRDDTGEFTEGDCIRFGVRQTSGHKQLYFAIIGFDENGTIDQIYPLNKGETEPLKANGLVQGNNVVWWQKIDKTIPRPPGAAVKCTFKLYVTAEPTNYSYMLQEGYSQTRSFGSEPIGLDDPDEWACKTIWCTLKDKK